MSETPFSNLVVVGSSAGGVEALSELVSTLPEGFGAPVVIAQHLDPERESHLDEILSRRSPLPVRTVTDRAPLEAGVVFVVPANRHVSITDSEIGLQEDSEGRPMPSVDRLMSTVAEIFGERLIAVVLTGTGTDGADGAHDVHRAGGTVVVQDPETADYGDMPGSLAPDDVDITAGLDGIGSVLRDLLSGAEMSEEDPDEDERQAVERFLEELRERHGADFDGYKTPTIMRRLRRRLVATDSENTEAYARYLDGHPEEYRQLVKSFLIQVTEFFRDPDLFAYLGEEVLPKLIEEARQTGDQLRIWSAGCATGEEAYSLAILVSELLGDEAGLFDARIFATDVDEDAVNFARQGSYPASALGGLSDEQVSRYFVEEDGRYRVKKQVRGMIVFGEHDLARRSPFPRLDLALSRNVLIYFDPELQERALRLFAYSLRNGGYLVLGKAESISPFDEYFEQALRQHKVFRRRGERFLMPPTASVGPAPRPRSGGRGGPDDARRDDSAAAPGPQPKRTHAAEERALNRLPVGVVVVDRRYDIQAINSAARRLFSIRGVAVGEDFLHLLQESIPYAEVRRAIDAAFGDGEPIRTGELAVEDVATGETNYLRLVCHPQRAEGERGPAETVTVVVDDVTEAARRRRELEERLESVRADFERFRREAEEAAARRNNQNRRLVEENRQLEEANRELTDLTTELRAANEEAAITTEEAQASAEEVETLNEELQASNEELQASNEELETLNEELQATVEELNTTNDDLQARTAELQDMARASDEERRLSEADHRRAEELAGKLREERSWLEAVMLNKGDAVLAVDAEGRILFSNGVFKELFEAAGDLGEEGVDVLGGSAALNEDGERLPSEATPQSRAARGEPFEMRFAVAVEDGSLRRFESRGRPIEGEGARGGVVIIREMAEEA